MEKYELKFRGTFVMRFISDGVEVEKDDVLKERWIYPCIYGEERVEKPGLCLFKNISEACKLLNRHIENMSKIALHTDVDMDGIGTTYIMKSFLSTCGIKQPILVINKDKVHGIQEKHAQYFKSNPIGLMIITDSSCNELDIIKKFTCDVIVIDHHEVLNEELCGTCYDGQHKFVVVNNTLDNDRIDVDKVWLRSRNCVAFESIFEYKGDSRMSCGLVVYELLRVYCECFGNPMLLENLMLYQWVGVTLFTDAIDLISERNQWYIEKTVHNLDLEATLRVTMHEINKYKALIDKSYINYSLAPLVNKAIRAGDSIVALNIVINYPSRIMELSVYNKMQTEAINKVVYSNYDDIRKILDYYIDKGYEEDVIVKELTAKGYDMTLKPKVYNTEYIMEDITNKGVSHNYTGVIAGRLAGDHGLNTVCYMNNGGVVKGSFRGRQKGTDYRGYFHRYGQVTGQDGQDGSVYAQGHKTAFGFECSLEQLTDIMHSINSIESPDDDRDYFSAGDMPVEEYGKYHIVSMDEFKKAGYLFKVGEGNARVTDADAVYIKVCAKDVTLKSIKGKLYLYDVFGLECKAFQELHGDYFRMYLEFTNELNFYIK